MSTFRGYFFAHSMHVVTPGSNSSRAGAMAWHPPIFPASFGQFPLPAPAPLSAPRIDPTKGLLGALANLPGPDVPTHGLLGAIAKLPSANPAAFPLFQRTGFTSGYGDRSAPPSLFSSLVNLPWSPPTMVSGGVSDAGDGSAELGFISSVSQPFCRTCSRGRLSSDGRFYTCLFATDGLDLRAALRSGASDAELGDLIQGRWAVRDDRYSEVRDARASSRGKKVEMYYIGG